MAGPIDAVVAIHNAFRQDMDLIDAAALDSARGKPGLEATVERFRFFNEVLEWHAHGEELAIFPALEAVGVMASTVPQDRFPELVAWMFPLLGDDDRENMSRIWQTVMPADAFAGATALVEQAIGDEWSELARRIPELEGAH